MIVFGYQYFLSISIFFPIGHHFWKWQTSSHGVWGYSVFRREVLSNFQYDWFHAIWYEDFVARSKYLRQGWVITSHSLLWDVITYPCLRYLLLATKSTYGLLWTWILFQYEYHFSCRIKQRWSYGGSIIPYKPHADGLVQERRKSSALAVELHHSSTDASV